MFRDKTRFQTVQRFITLMSIHVSPPLALGAGLLDCDLIIAAENRLFNI